LIPVKKWSTVFRAIPQTKEKEAVAILLPISMHTGQIILMTKMFTEADLAFYDFSGSGPALTVARSAK
jgi:hypothetical protein